MFFPERWEPDRPPIAGSSFFPKEPPEEPLTPLSEEPAVAHLEHREPIQGVGGWAMRPLSVLEGSRVPDARFGSEKAKQSVRALQNARAEKPIPCAWMQTGDPDG